MLLRRTVIFLLFFLPFLIFPASPSFFETPKIFITEICIILFSLFSVFSNTKLLSYQSRSTTVLFVLLFLLTLYHLIFHHTSVLFLGNQFREQGVFLLWLLLLFSYFAANVRLEKVPQGLITCAIIGELLASIFISTTSGNRAVGTLGEPNALAAFAVFLWPFSFQLLSHSKQKKVLFFFLTLFTLLIILVSGSRSGLIAFFLEAVFFSLTLCKVSVRKSALITLILLALSLLLPFFDKKTPYENRAEIWKTSLIAGYAHPIVGFGFGNTEIALKEYNIKLFNSLRGYYVDSAHNIFLDWWIQGGFIGISILTLLIYNAYKTYITTKNVRNTTLLFGLLTSLLFNPASIVTLLAFWWIIGLGSSHKDPLNR